jgi:dynein heavy chain
MLAFEEVLDIGGEGNYDNLYNLKMEFDLRYNLWKGLEDFQVLKEDLEKKKIKEIDVKPTMQVVEKYVRIVNQCERSLSENPIVPRLKNMVWVIKDSLPAVNALKSQYLEEEHVAEIAQILNEPFDQNDETLTLGKLLDIKINEKSN